ncbi:hypothetical protein M0R45_007862 [Rubus argutus]|uniref:Uncharacterized protein n=1 Tax=Rubus argutus TaxID=59490 RepID=A0AAW1XZ21_RUBAR
MPTETKGKLICSQCCSLTPKVNVLDFLLGYMGIPDQYKDAPAQNLFNGMLMNGQSLAVGLVFYHVGWNDDRWKIPVDVTRPRCDGAVVTRHSCVIYWDVNFLKDVRV